MMNNNEYKQAIKQAKRNLTDAHERGAEALGGSWEELRKELFTPEELAVSAIRVAIMIEVANARKERGLSQKKLEGLSGVKQPIIARMERGSTSSHIDTILKVLAPLGKTLAVVPLIPPNVQAPVTPIITESE